MKMNLMYVPFYSQDKKWSNGFVKRLVYYCCVFYFPCKQSLLGKALIWRMKTWEKMQFYGSMILPTHISLGRNCNGTNSDAFTTVYAAQHYTQYISNRIYSFRCHASQSQTQIWFSGKQHMSKILSSLTRPLTFLCFKKITVCPRLEWS